MYELELSVQSIDFDELSARLCDLPGLQGIQDLTDEGAGLHQVPKEFDVLEFGSESSKKYAQWLQQQRHSSARVKIFVEGIDEVEIILAKLLEGLTHQVISINALDPKNYIDEYKKTFQGMEIGKSLWVGPSWAKHPQGKIRIEIEPGLAFGTGDHPTTYLCAERLEELVSRADQFKHILDLGSGSSVLSIVAGALLEAESIDAVDLDPYCREAHVTALDRNQNILNEKCNFRGYFGEEEVNSFWTHCPDQSYDLIISNIYAEVLGDLYPQIFRVLKPGGTWLLSGVLQGDKEEELKAIASQNFQLGLRRDRADYQLSLTEAEGVNESPEHWVLLEYIKED